MKNTLSLILFALLLIPSMGTTQDSNFEIKLKSGAFTPEVVTDFEKVLELQLTESNQEYIYRIIQFYSIPTQTEKQIISEKGIELISYLPNKAFLVKLSNAISNAQLAQLNIRSIFVMDDHFKVSPRLTKEELPEYAMKGNDILLNVKYFSETDKTDLINALTQEGGKVLDGLEKINMITIQYPATKINDLAKNPLIQWIEPVSAPSNPESTAGKINCRSNALNTSYGAGRKYDGSGVVVSVADDGVVGPHIDLEGRVTMYTVENDGDHGDMTTGIFAGAGNLDPTIGGMAPGADMHVYRNGIFVFLSSQIQILNAVENWNTLGLTITSTSYSQGVGGVYDNSTEFIDQQVNETPFLTHVFAAGNSGTLDHGYGAGAGWGNISGGMKAGKNVICAGNVTATDGLDATSSRGPAADGRIKPDLLANGTGHLSTDENYTYQVGAGTSAASPTIAGVVAQLYQAYKEHNNGVNPESGLIKAALLNTAEDLGNPGPDFQNGWGRINGLKAVRIIEDNRFVNGSIEQGGSNSHMITVPDNVSQVRIMTYWTDVEGNPSSAVGLVNDINMEVLTPNMTLYNPLVLDHTPTAASLDADAIQGIDNLNNVEQVRIDNPEAGEYNVSLNGFAIPEGPQNYFVLYDFIFDEVELTYPLGGEGFVPGETEMITWDASISTEDFDLEYSIDGGNSYVSIATRPGDARSYGWTIPNTISGEVKVRISRGTSISESDTEFTIVGVPNNLNVARVCPDEIELNWDPVDGATMYEVSMLGDKYMDSIGVATANSFIVSGLNPNEHQWFSVKAVVSGSKGRRAIAINKPPGTGNCILDNDLETGQLLSVLDAISSCRGLGNVEIAINVNNLGLQAASGANMNYQIDNGTIVTEPLSMDLQPGENTDFVFATIADFSILYSGEVSIWVSMPNDENFFNDTLTTPYQTYSNTLIDDFPHFQGFQSFNQCPTLNDCEQINCTLGSGWSNYINLEGDDIDWRTDADGTDSGNTGPTFDFDNGTSEGKYLYLEGTSCTLREGILISPCIDLTFRDDASAQFAYHMFGSGIGELHVDIITDDGEILDIVSPIIGEQGDFWELLFIDLTPYVGGIVNLKIRGTIGDIWTGRGDVAIDAFLFDASPLSSTTNVQKDLASRIKIYPNPTSSDFTVNFPQQLSNQNTRIELFDILGKRIVDIQSNNNRNVPVDISNLVSGIYFINVSGEGFEVIKKLIKQ